MAFKLSAIRSAFYSATTVVMFGLTPYAVSARQSIQTAFSPSSESIDLVIDSIVHAKESIETAAYSFSSDKVADALMAASQRGVEVHVVLDKTHAARRYKAVVKMHEAGIPIRINYHYAIMHNKYLIIDHETVETGSFNYTASAERRNAENVIVIKKNKTLAQKYLENWQSLWDEGEDYE
jgi:phosphatidylserine/phosphatidylglycerophosphate/cardiolipin synthase-like enzyme